LRTLQRQLGMCALTQVNPTWRPADPISLSSHTRVIARSHATGGSESAGSIGGLPAFSTQVHRRRLRSPPGLPGRQNAEPGHEASRLDRGSDAALPHTGSGLDADQANHGNVKAKPRHLTQIRRTERTPGQTGAVEKPPDPSSLVTGARQ
jgi:hypothetical protein